MSVRRVGLPCGSTRFGGKAVGGTPKLSYACSGWDLNLKDLDNDLQLKFLPQTQSLFPRGKGYIHRFRGLLQQSPEALTQLAIPS